jgi:hypothetical protein
MNANTEIAADSEQRGADRRENDENADLAPLRDQRRRSSAAAGHAQSPEAMDPGARLSWFADAIPEYEAMPASNPGVERGPSRGSGDFPGIAMTLDLLLSAARFWPTICARSSRPPAAQVSLCSTSRTGGDARAIMTDGVIRALGRP